MLVRSIRETNRVVMMAGRGGVARLDFLPSAKTRRWVIQRKAEVVEAVDGGVITLDEACRRWRLSREEFDGWRQAISRHGLPGLRATRARQYRRQKAGSGARSETGSGAVSPGN